MRDTNSVPRPRMRIVWPMLRHTAPGTRRRGGLRCYRTRSKRRKDPYVRGLSAFAQVIEFPFRRGGGVAFPRPGRIRADHATVPAAPPRAGLPERRGRDPGRPGPAPETDPSRRGHRPRLVAHRDMAGERANAARRPSLPRTPLVVGASLGPPAAAGRANGVGLARFSSSRLIGATATPGGERERPV